MQRLDIGEGETALDLAQITDGKAGAFRQGFDGDAPGLAQIADLAPSLIGRCIGAGRSAILAMARMSFNLHPDQRLYVPGFTFDHYVQLISNPVFTNAIWTTVKLALMATFATVAIGYAFALLVWLKPPRWRLLLIGLALCPLLISEIAIIFGWWMFFPKNGLLSYALVSLGLVSDKVSLMYTEFAAFVGLIYVTLPYCFFILLSIFDGIDKRMARRLPETLRDIGT